MLEVVWPERFHPDPAPVHVRNDLRMSVDPPSVWAWLVRATGGPDWYENASDVRLIEAGDARDLDEGRRFRWRTFGLRIESTVREPSRSGARPSPFG